ncbi:MAG: siderophore-interacting protein [Alphaproteobacteria bacterium]|nr:siderophore-interacting protein [Alphaproteobacteria bacterium]
MRHEIIRIRHEAKRRTLSVQQVERLSPAMIRIVFGGKELADFASAAFDDHVKLFFPNGEEAIKRDYTPRAFDRKAERLTIDFALHEAGPATDWAAAATAGDTIDIGGPRMSTIVPEDYDWWILVGDEASLPAIARRLEEMPHGAPVTALVAVCGSEEEQCLATDAALDLVWVHRPLDRANEPDAMIAALASIEPRDGDGFVWIAGESTFARAIRAEFIERRGHPHPWIKARGYWKKGAPGAHEKLDD